jgi:hypothetical protein
VRNGTKKKVFGRVQLQKGLSGFNPKKPVNFEGMKIPGRH